MVHRKQIIDEVLEEAVPAETKKMQLLEKVELEEPALEDGDATDLTIHRIYVVSKFEAVYLG